VKLPGSLAALGVLGQDVQHAASLAAHRVAIVLEFVKLDGTDAVGLIAHEVDSGKLLGRLAAELHGDLALELDARFLQEARQGLLLLFLALAAREGVEGLMVPAQVLRRSQGCSTLGAWKSPSFVHYGHMFLQIPALGKGGVADCADVRAQTFVDRALVNCHVMLVCESFGA
jgi:hypothetical protein